MQNESKVTESGPVFIHSLFRAGSTYLFSVFRRSDANYWCYQEPLSEAALLSKRNKELLSVGYGLEKAKQLRHPLLDSPYFKELYEVADKCVDFLREEAIYNDYFNVSESQTGIEYWKALIRASKGVPVIQECRTASRIVVIKRSLGGEHVYLWRNPRDQWWSYRINDYFPAAQQLFVNASNPPPVISRLRAEICFQACESVDPFVQFEHFRRRPLSAEHGYLVFYTLWCLGLDQGLLHADLLLNIDHLATDPEYRSEIETKLLALGVGGLSFDDCHIPIGSYGEQDHRFFAQIEDRVHGLLLSSGVSRERIESIVALRQKYAPLESETVGRDSLRDAERVRAVVRNLDDMLASQARALLAADAATKVATTQLSSAQTELSITSAHAAEFGTQAEELRRQLQEVGAANHHHWALSEERAKHAEFLRGEAERLAREVDRYSTHAEQQASVLDQALRQASALQERLAQEQQLLREAHQQYRNAANLAAERGGRVASLEADLKVSHQALQQLMVVHEKLEQEQQVLRQHSLSAADSAKNSEEQLSRQAQQISELEMDRELLFKANESLRSRSEDEKRKYDELKAAYDALAQTNHSHFVLMEERGQALNELRAAHEALLQTNHFHWVAAEERSEALRKLQAEQDALLQINHHHWVRANVAESQINALRASRSWRVTAPLRDLGENAKKIPGVKRIYEIAGDPVGHAMRYVTLRPKLKHVVFRICRPFPAVLTRLQARRAVQLQRDVGEGNSSSRHVSDGSVLEQSHTESSVLTDIGTGQFDTMTPAARTIFKKLTDAAARVNRE